MSAQVKLRSDAIEWRKLEDEIVALDLRSSEYLAINPTGAAIWDLLVEGAAERPMPVFAQDEITKLFAGG